MSIGSFLEAQRRVRPLQGDGNSNRGVYTGIVTHAENVGDPDNPHVFAVIPEISQEVEYGPCRWISHGRAPETNDVCLLVITKNDVWLLEYTNIEVVGEGGEGEPGPAGPPGPTGPAGPQGPAGAAGAPGAAGAAGAAGTPGEKWFSGAGAPAGATGIVGDWYIDTATGGFYEKTGASAWTLRGTFIGPAGATGATGATGPTGPTGPPGAVPTNIIVGGTGAAQAPNGGVTVDLTGMTINFTRPGTYMMTGLVDMRIAVAGPGGSYAIGQFAVAGAGVTIQQVAQVWSLQTVGERIRLPIMATVVVPDAGGGTVPSGALVKVQGVNSGGSNGAAVFEPAGSLMQATIINGVGLSGAPGGPGGFDLLVRARRSAAQAVTSGAVVAMTLPLEDYDTGNIFTPGAGVTLITVPIAGYYEITGHCGWGANPTGTRYMALDSGGTLVADARAPGPTGGIGTEQHLSIIAYLNAGANVSLQVGQWSGATLDCVGWLQVARIVDPARTVAAVANVIPRGTSLPVSPLDGEMFEWIVPASGDYPCTAYLMRYTNSPLFGTNPWECIGGQWMTGQSNVQMNTSSVIPTGTAVYPGPFTVPHSGVWAFRWSGYLSPVSGAGAVSGYLGIMPSSGGNLPEPRAAGTYAVGYGSSVAAECQVQLARGTVVWLGAATLSGQVMGTYNRQVSIQPVRITRD